jgi:hypothetical protein
MAGVIKKSLIENYFKKFNVLPLVSGSLSLLLLWTTYKSLKFFHIQERNSRNMPWRHMGGEEV